MRHLGLGLILGFVSSCGGHQEPVSDVRYATYLERTSEGYLLINWFPDADCELTLLNGPNLNELEVAPTRHCTQQELQQGEGLLAKDAWLNYPDVMFTGTMVDGPASDENGTPQSNVDYPVGYVRVERIYFPNEPRNTKHFDANTNGPEAEVIEYFRHLQKTYGDN